MKMKKKFKIALIVLAVCIVLIFGLVIGKLLLKEKEKAPTETNVATITNQIKEYNYTLDDRDTELFENLFQSLKENLEGEEINKEEYVKTMAEMFIVDLFTIDNKISKYDIGGLDYIYPAAYESFRSKILDTIYKTVEDNSYKTRKQNLPVVKSIKVEEAKKSKYVINDSEKNSYNITLSWDYEESLGYDTKGIVTLIEEENKWYVIAYTPTK